MTNQARDPSHVDRLLLSAAFGVLFAATLVALLWPREQVGQRFVDGGGSIVAYDNHVGVRLAVLGIGLLIAGTLRLVGRRSR